VEWKYWYEPYESYSFRNPIKMGFIRFLGKDTKEKNIAQLYENQASTLLSESTTANNSGSFETVVFPIVRRVFSKLLANDIVSVQAMNMPIGKLFFFVPQTSSRVDALGVMGNNYAANGGDGLWYYIFCTQD
jgi:hypothetical protein